jgi:hypothetical protein
MGNKMIAKARNSFKLIEMGGKGGGAGREH